MASGAVEQDDGDGRKGKLTHPYRIGSVREIMSFRMNRDGKRIDLTASTVITGILNDVGGG